MLPLEPLFSKSIGGIMLEQEREPVICYECDTEFVVHTPYEDDQDVSFCPFCGSETEGDEVDSFEDTDDDDDTTDKF
jgi:rRNA maturation endonuclease Nob1